MSRLPLLLRPRMVALHLLAVVLVVVMANLSMWQFNRLNDRKDFNASVRDRASMEPVPIADLLSTRPEDGEWRPVVAKGMFRAEDEVIVLNRSQDNMAGVDALTPFDFTVDGKNYVVLVDRGFVPLTAEIPAPPSGEVEFLGRVSEGEKRQLFRTADIFVSPATGRESFGIVLLEAMAAGTPLVASDLPGYRRLTDDGRAAELVPPGDIDALTAALRRVLQHPASSAAAVQHGRMVAARCSINELAACYEAIYRRVIEPVTH